MPSVHSVAMSGFGEGTNELYDRARPSYPAASLRRVHDAVLRTRDSASSSSSDGNASQGLTILEPGSGTGIFTRLLLAPPPPPSQPSGQTTDSATYPEWNIRRLVAIEPSAGMRAQWQKSVDKVLAQRKESGQRVPEEVRAVEGGFDDYAQAGVEEGSVDLIVIAQAYHWCQDHEAAFREAARYLAPHGLLVFVWNLEKQGTPWYDFIKPLYQTYDLGTPQYYKMLWKEGYATEAYRQLFLPAEHGQDEWSLGMTEQMVQDRTLSKSFLTEQHLSGQARQDFLVHLKQVIDSAPKTWIDKEKGIFEYTYQTDVFIMRKKQ